MHTDTATELFLPLERRDLIRLEQRLRRLVGVFLPHEACSLYFPGDTEDRRPEYLPDEERLLLPLYDPRPEASRLLGIFVARGVKSEDYEALKTRLPQVAEAAMENLFAYKAALCDSVTGLLTRRNFIARLTHEADGVRDSLRPASTSLAKGAADPEMPAETGAHPFLATLVIRLHGLRQVVSKHGYTVADDMLSLAGQSLRDVCPEQGTTARIGDYEFAVLMPAATAKTCRRLAGVILETLSNVGIPHELTRSRISVTASIGYALYPQDITGNVLMKPSREQAQILLRKARLAAALAAERLLPVLAFGRILAEGGRVTSLLPLSRFGISLGSSVNAREGQRFSVYSSGGGKTGAPGREAGAYKGEVVLVEVKENSSVAEIIHQADPSVSLAEGDVLVLLPGEVWGAARTPGNKKGGAGTPDPATNLLRHGDFLAAWSGEREKCGVFSLGLLRIAPHLVHEGGQECGEQDEPAGQAPLMPPDTLLAEAVRIFEDVFGRGIVGGRYGLTSLMAFHPGVSPEELLPKYQEVCALLSSRLFPGVSGPVAAAGLAGHPYLDFRKADALENCNKALEYAILLPSPYVGVFDSLAMTISADKRFSAGDFLGAMTEYKQALLADGSNALAWNSLGVTLARLGRHDEARGHFDKAIALAPEAMTLYNMGYSCQCLGERADAKRYYEECLAIDGAHMYALVRLGQLAENDGDFAAARGWYGKAGEAPGGRSVTRRHLAGLSLKEDKKDEAREHLHEALSLDPQNAVALQMLAEIYLDGGEDAEVAESLARQSVALSPVRKAGWLVLSRALERSGRYRDAREALMRAGAL